MTSSDTSPRGLYQRAQWRERDARAALANPEASEAETLAAVRAAVAAYRRIVRQYPRSGYCDNALWLAAQLSRDGYTKFGQTRDGSTAEQLLAMLIREYPTSRLVPLARAAAKPAAPVTPPPVAARPADVVQAQEPVAPPPPVAAPLPRTAPPPVPSSARSAAVRAPEPLPSRPIEVRSDMLPPWTVASSDTSPRGLYQRAQWRERDARAALADPEASEAETLTAVRSAVAAYRRIVRQYPRSGYCDNALWLAAQLSLDGYAKFGQERDGSTGEQLLAMLIREYPTSRLVPLARAAVKPETPAAPVPAPAVEARPSGAVPAREPAETPPAAAPSETPEGGAAVDAPAGLWSRPVELEPGFLGPWEVSLPGPKPPTRRIVPTPYTVMTPGDLFATQPAVQVSAAAQFTTGDEARVGGQPRVAPDLGIRVMTPGLRIGNLYADVNITDRDGRAALGRAVVRLDGFRAAGLSWAVNAGDTWTAPVMPGFGFANLFAPVVTFQGASVIGSSPGTFLLLSGGRVTAQRNIFGTDTIDVGQRLFQGLFSHRGSDRWDILARGAYVRGREVPGYSASTAESAEGGAGFRFRPTQSLELVGDGGVTRARRTGSSDTEVGPTALLGAVWSMPRGWFQLNAQRFAPGHYPVLNYPFTNRAGAFAAGEWDVSGNVRVFGGGEHVMTNLDSPSTPVDATRSAPGSYSRGYGGVRVGLFDSSLINLRVEQGGRRLEASTFSPGFQSDTGVVTAEWHARFRAGNAFARYERRENVNQDQAASDFTQHDATGQVYYSLASMRQVFAQVTLSRREDGNGGGQTLWLAGGGTQLSFGRVYFRVEANASRMLDWATQVVTPRQTLSTGLSGEIADRTYLSFDWFVDHSSATAVSPNPWVTRTMVRLTRAFPFGSARSPQFGGQVIDGPTGGVTGIVFADWDGNGMMGTGEEAVSGISFSIGSLRSVTSGADGRFVFSRVPVGAQLLSVDLASLPADFDPPAEAERPVSVERGQTANVELGLFPLGSFHGMVYQDIDRDGQLGASDTPVDGAVVVMDDGARTEVTRNGRFSFDPVRMGEHVVSLLVASLPEGAQVAGPTTATVNLKRNQQVDAVVFLVTVDKRPEIRKVFPPKK